MSYVPARPSSARHSSLPGIAIALHLGLLNQKPLAETMSAARRAGLAKIAFVTQPGSNPN